MSLTALRREPDEERQRLRDAFTRATGWFTTSPLYRERALAVGARQSQSTGRRAIVMTAPTQATVMSTMRCWGCRDVLCRTGAFRRCRGGRP